MTTRPHLEEVLCSRRKRTSCLDPKPSLATLKPSVVEVEPVPSVERKHNRAGEVAVMANGVMYLFAVSFLNIELKALKKPKRMTHAGTYV